MAREVMFLVGMLHMTYAITHTFSALCIHTIHFGRVASTAKKLAEHRAKLCLLGLKELQKSWDLENWVLDLFFHCLDDRTAQNLRLIDNGMSASALSELTKGPQIPDSSLHTPCSTTSRPLSPTAADSMLPVVQNMNQIEDASVNIDWYEIFNVEAPELKNDYIQILRSEVYLRQ
ncbi:hypothetical protein PENSUB_9097 [Penicillium subrubescens]|uniref:Uncharacterized protein n=1 Tax=Penicillium subrubescens TaxID=1316194 RepID=A0A1Q5TEK3_9EURO|nr:hypothetical protein PENSUB_9097 [Penicillium subrubescens]